MTDKRILFKGENGQMTVISPVLTEGQTPAQVAADMVPEGVEYQLVTEAELLAAMAAEPTPDSDRLLTRPQFAFLLALTGFDDVWDALGAGAKAAGDMVAYATLKAERDRSAFRLDRTLGIVAQFRATAAQIAPDVDLSEAAIRAAWDQAEAFKGAANG